MASNSQQSSTSKTYPVVFDLAKFSYATCSSNLSSPINWTHLPDRDNIHAVFDSVRVYSSSGRVEEKMVLKVIRGTEVMEESNLTALSGLSKTEESQLQAGKIQAGELSILLIYKAPCLAIRYPVAHKQSRRIQMRFQEHTQYYEALSIMSQVGFSLKEAASQRPTLSRYRPITTTSPDALAYIRDSASQVQTAVGVKDALNSRQASLDQPIAPIIVSEGKGKHLSEPTSSSSSTTIAPTVALPGAQYSIATSPISSQRQSITSNYEDFPGTHADSTLEQSAKDILESDAQKRPEPAPEEYSISQIMPPRRELPFAKPLSRSSSKAGKFGNSVGSTDTATISTSVNKAVVEKQKGSRLHIRGPKKTKSTARAPTVKEHLEMLNASPALQAQRYHFPQRLPSASTYAPEDADVRLAGERFHISPEEAAQRSNGRRQCLDVSHTPSMVEGQPPSNAASPPRHDDNSEGNANAFSQPPRRDPTPVPHSGVDPWGAEEMDLERFMSKSQNERQGEIEEWICRQLTDPNFKVLCEEVEVCWRRVLLGERGITEQTV